MGVPIRKDTLSVSLSGTGSRHLQGHGECSSRLSKLSLLFELEGFLMERRGSYSLVYSPTHTTQSNVE